MVQKAPTKKQKTKLADANPFQFQKLGRVEAEDNPPVHIHAHGVICDTEGPGSSRPRNKTPLELVVDATEGFIPLWEEGAVLRWRFQERSFRAFKDPEAAKAAAKELLGEAILAWGDANPIKFTQQDDAWDFEIVIRENDQCNVSGCVLASAFFPDTGRHKLVLYPKLFSQSKREQVDTLIHEVGHIFGLRHFFAKVSEGSWPAEIFGTHNRFTIMNYGEDSTLTDADKSDLKKLYQAAWSGELKNINGTEIRFVKPYHTL